MDYGTNGERGQDAKKKKPGENGVTASKRGATRKLAFILNTSLTRQMPGVHMHDEPIIVKYSLLHSHNIDELFLLLAFVSRPNRCVGFDPWMIVVVVA